MNPPPEPLLTVRAAVVLLSALRSACWPEHSAISRR